MSEEYGGDFISLTADDGSEFELELLDAWEMDGVLYHAFVPADADADGEEDLGIIILKSIDKDGEEVLSTPDSEDELEAAYQQFMLRLFEEDEEQTD